MNLYKNMIRADERKNMETVDVAIVFSHIMKEKADLINKYIIKINELYEKYKSCGHEEAPIYFDFRRMDGLKTPTNTKYFLDDELIKILHDEIKKMDQYIYFNEVNVQRNFRNNDPKSFSPSLRFMCDLDFVLEAHHLYDMTNWVNPRQHDKEWFKWRFLDTFEEYFPLIAKADRAMGGKFSEVIQMMHDDFKNMEKYFWKSIIISMQNGNPLRTIETCEYSLALRNKVIQDYTDESEIEINNYFY